MRRAFLVLVSVVLALVAGGAPASAAPVAPASTVSVGGTVGAPATYTPAQLDALPQTSLPVRWAGWLGAPRAVGPSLADLVARSAPQLPAGRNPALQVTVTVTGSGGRTVAFALGELDPRFGDRPAVLTQLRLGPVAVPTLVVPGDRDGSRTVLGVRSVRVGLVDTGAGPAVDGVRVVDGARTTTLTPQRLAALPQRTTTVTFTAGGVPQTRTETGPTLAAVLAAAGVRTDARTVVAAVADDGYVAAVTPAEATAGGAGLGLALVEDGVVLTRPRLVVAGDLAGGRYVSGVVRLVLTRG